MGTSLSGLTPATTFDGLLKVGDNDPLTSTLKAISTGDGTDTMLELSTTALQIGGATGMYWDNTNKRLGIATDAPSVPFEVYGGVRFRDNLNLNGTLSNSSTGEVNINNLGFFDAVSSKVGIGENTPTSRLHIKGEGATSATTSLLVQNSDGDDMFSVRDDGKINADNDFYVQGAIYGGSNTKLRVGTDLNIASTRAWIQGLGATSATTALLVENSAGTDTLEVRDDGRVVTGKGATTNANGTFNVLHGVSNLTTRVFTVSRDSVLRGMDINSGGATKISDSSGDQSFSHTATAVLEVSSTCLLYTSDAADE